MNAGLPRFAHGLVIGKFYPPHAGHHHLIDTAAERCARLSVVVAASTAESVPLALRAAWLREAHLQPGVTIAPVVDDVEIDYDDPEVWSAHVEVFRHALALAHGEVPAVDAVFSSEEYGPELARRLGAVHVGVDPGRERFPVSGTTVRSDPVSCWRWLSPAVRGHLARRVVVVGAESSGTTTLARALAAHYAARGGPWAGTRWVPEYGRTYCEEKLALARRRAKAAGLPEPWLDGLEWESAEFALIAERQLLWEDAAARAGSPLLVCDTDAFATSLWHERYLSSPGAVHPRARHDLWIHTSVEGVPFEQDGWRDGEAVRHRMDLRFREELAARGLPHLVVSGPPRARLEQAVEAVDGLLARGWDFAPPP
ncbi:transcriptional regulator NadR [Planomonospora parontospora subsp. parontospora]|uniref:Transcriptional regulator NadR n=2 Tax=Planomonospora parontospora TaxID=58119 RepID=A0AA37F491_9ACTN|nr:AAA family ATPase [Planomonospora parontospora]GGK64127.1 transcriptional regulator NadR [Planomonospora parontospora]GII08123.1 transcriptional regulator NadR [Planomonospora parontospora subsp. parontospora]